MVTITITGRYTVQLTLGQWNALFHEKYNHNVQYMYFLIHKNDTNPSWRRLYVLHVFRQTGNYFHITQNDGGHYPKENCI